MSVQYHPTAEWDSIHHSMQKRYLALARWHLEQVAAVMELSERRRNAVSALLGIELRESIIINLGEDMLKECLQVSK